MPFMPTKILQMLAENRLFSDIEAAKAADLPAALDDGDYDTLLENLRLVLRTVGFYKYNIRSIAKDSQYNELCQLSRSRLGFVITKEIYTTSLDNQLDKKFVHDMLFHFCQNDAAEAGKVLNKSVWKFWHSDISDRLIQYGADVNAKSSSTTQSTLFQAVRSDVSLNVIRHLIMQGANYRDCEQEVNGVKYPLMLVAALGSDALVLSLLAEKFPDEVGGALLRLNEMQQAYEDNKFALDFGDYNVTAITRDDLLKAEHDLLRVQVRQSVYGGQSIFSHSMNQSSARVVLDEDKSHSLEAGVKLS
jgi:hypothetical protein